jgi:hypothetical protein
VPVALALAFALALLSAAGCGQANLLRTGDTIRALSVGNLPNASVPTGAHGPALALAVARSLVSAVRVPSDATPVAGVPRSSPLRLAPGRPATPNLVDVHRIWRVSGRPREVLAAVRQSRPTGLAINGGGSAGQHGVGQREVEYWWYVSFQAAARAGLGSEALAISTTAAPGGGTLVRADGEVVWLSARPSAERVPAGVRSVEVTRGPTYKRVTLRRTISSQASVRRVVAVLNALPIVQPGAWSCPAEPLGPVVGLTLRGSAGGVLARATQAAGAEVGNCSPMSFSVGGRAQTPLAEGARVVAVAGRALGVVLLAR